VESWPRVTSKRINADLQEGAQGAYTFSKLEHLLPAPNRRKRVAREKKRRGSGTRGQLGMTRHSCDGLSARSLVRTLWDPSRGHWDEI